MNTVLGTDCLGYVELISNHIIIRGAKVENCWEYTSRYILQRNSGVYAKTMYEASHSGLTYNGDLGIALVAVNKETGQSC